MNIAAAIVIAVGVAIVLGVIAAWPVMLLWGAIAGTYGLPTMGLGTAFQVSMLTALLFRNYSD